MLLNGEAVRNFVGECGLHLAATIVAARHEDNVFALGLRRGIERRDRRQDGLACGVKGQLDDFAFDQRKIDAFVNAAADSHHGIIVANALAAPPTLRLEAFGTASEQLCDLPSALRPHELSQMAHGDRLSQVACSCASKRPARQLEREVSRLWAFASCEHGLFFRKASPEYGVLHLQQPSQEKPLRHLATRERDWCRPRTEQHIRRARHPRNRCPAREMETRTCCYSFAY